MADFLADVTFARGRSSAFFGFVVEKSAFSASFSFFLFCPCIRLLEEIGGVFNESFLFFAVIIFSFGVLLQTIAMAITLLVLGRYDQSILLHFAAKLT